MVHSQDRVTLGTGSRGFLLLLSAAYAALLLFRIDVQSLWLDEVWTVSVASSSWEAMWGSLLSLPEQHPLYYLLLRPWLVVSQSDLAVRLFSVIFAIATLWAVYELAIEVAGTAVARVSAIILVSSPYYLYMGQEARMYTLLGLLTAVNSVCYLRWMRRRSRSYAAGYLLISILGVYTHLYFHFVLLAQLCHRYFIDRAWTRQLRTLIAVQALVIASYVPWAVAILTRGTAAQSWKDLDNVIFAIPYTLFRFTLGYSVLPLSRGWQESVWPLLAADAWLILPAAMSCAVLLMVGFRHLLKSDRIAGSYLAFGLTVPFLVVSLLSLITIIAGDRYFVVSYSMYAILLASGIVALYRRRGWPARVGITVTTGLACAVSISLLNYYFSPEYGKEQWKDVAQLLTQHATPQDRIVVHEAYMLAALLRYYQPPAEQVVLGSNQFPRHATPAGSRLWVVKSHAPEYGPFDTQLHKHHSLVRQRVFPHQSGIVVSVLEPIPPPDTAVAAFQSTNSPLH